MCVVTGNKLAESQGARRTRHPGWTHTTICECGRNHLFKERRRTAQHRVLRLVLGDREHLRLDLQWNPRSQQRPSLWNLVGSWNHHQLSTKPRLQSRLWFSETSSLTFVKESTLPVYPGLSDADC